jgi:hypothetical protein
MFAPLFVMQIQLLKIWDQFDQFKPFAWGAQARWNTHIDRRSYPFATLNTLEAMVITAILLQVKICVYANVQA